MKKYLSISAIIILVDQITKWWIVGKFPQEGMGETITSFFNLARVHNHGAAFSFLSDAGGWQRWFFTILAIAVAVFIVRMLKQNEGTQRFKIALSLILGGAIGNVIDRLIHGYVVDFFDFHFNFLSGIFHQSHYPAFNIADSAIVCGAILLITDEFKRWRASKSA